MRATESTPNSFRIAWFEDSGRFRATSPDCPELVVETDCFDKMVTAVFALLSAMMAKLPVLTFVEVVPR
jgi:hypothetical protein